MSKFRYNALTISNTNGKTYWQNPHKTAEKAMRHALKYRKQLTLCKKNLDKNKYIIF